MYRVVFTCRSLVELDHLSFGSAEIALGLLYILDDFHAFCVLPVRVWRQVHQYAPPHSSSVDMLLFPCL